MKSQRFSATQLEKDILKEAKSLDIPAGAAADIAARTIAAVERKLKGKTTITERDYCEIVTAELEKYNSDLAYIYHNRDKII